VSSYAELHKHSYWSLLDAVGSAEQGARRAAELGHPALAMTEHGVLSGTVHHIDACREVGITPIVGLEGYYREQRKPFDKETNWEYFHMLLLAKDLRGWRALSALSSESYRSGFYRKPCFDDELLDKYAEHIFISTSCVSGFIPRAILRDDEAAVKRHCEKLTRWVGDDWYFEIQPHDFDDLRVVNQTIPQLAQAYGRPLVVARDAHAPNPSWIETQHVSVKMRTKGSMISAPRKEGEPDEKYDMTAADTAYISSAEQTLEDFRRYHPRLDERVVSEAISNTGWVAGQIAPWLMDRRSKMPRYHDTDEQDYHALRRQIYAGLEQLGHADDQRYIDAAEKELKIFREKRFCAFFLLLSDMIRWLRSPDPLPATDEDPNPAPKKPQKVGLGRGSAGGCVTAYALRITLINPITYDLSFERFLNPDRAGMPDVDIDLTSEGADLGKEWLKRRNGADHVYDLISHGTMQPKAALRRVGMVYEIPHARLNHLSKQIPDEYEESDVESPLEIMRRDLPDLDRYAEENPDAWCHSVRMQGAIGTQSEHAAGVIVSRDPIEQLMPVMKKSAKDDYLVTAFGNSARKKVVADLGFLKVDLLVVVALARQQLAEELIGRVHDVDVDLDSLPALKDPHDVDRKTMDIFSQGRIRGVFQWDGFSNMAAITKQIGPENIFHLAAANAGVRPGVSRSIGEYVRRRHGAEFEYWDPSVQPALAETYGVPLYQEQIMAIFQHLGGYSAAEADTVRRIMGEYYRIRGDVASRMLGAYEERFVASAASVCKGGRAVAERIWDYCGRSSEYLFNKSHADEYSLIAYGDAWLKAHYPDAFYASLLTFPPAWVKKPAPKGVNNPSYYRNIFYARTVREARSFGLKIEPPDVNESDEGFTIHGDRVRFGLKAIKGLGGAMVADVLSNRPFDSLQEMSDKLVACNAAGVHALAQAGALDRFGARENLTADERSQFEEARIGAALSSPDRLRDMREDLRRILHTQDEFDAAPNGEALVVGGEIVSGREVRTKSPHGPALKLTVAFDADEYEVSVPPWEYSADTPPGRALREIIATDEPIVVRGAKDAAWDCVAADEIKLAREVLDMMSKQTAVAA
jgi:DNA polymerase-3 subunit alpha